MTDSHLTYCDNHFMIDENQILMVYIFNLYNAVCHLHLNKTEKNKNENKKTLPPCEDIEQPKNMLMLCF